MDNEIDITHVRHVFSIGGSLAITLPNKFMERLNIKEGDMVVINEHIDHLLVQKADIRGRHLQINERRII